MQRQNDGATSPQPILARKPLDAGEFFLAVCNDRAAQRKRLRYYEQIIATNRLAGLLKLRSNRAVSLISRWLKRENLQRSKDYFQLSRELR